MNLTSNTKITITIVIIVLALFLVIGYMSGDKNNKIAKLTSPKPVVANDTSKTFFYEKEGKYYAKFVGGGYDDRVVEVTPDFYSRMIAMFPRGGANGHVPTETADIIG
jgi:hypothetical protein